MPQQVTTGPALMKGIERMNTVVVRGSGVGVGQNMGVPPRRDPFAMDINRGRNCYTCGGLGTWPITAEIEGREGEWQTIGKGSREEEELRRSII